MELHDGEVGPIRIGVSACLLGREVRFDGGHKRDRFVTDVLGNFVEYVPVCPEFEAGLGVPRPSIRLEQHAGGVKVVEPRSGRDHTKMMVDVSRERVRALSKLHLTGYILKSKSPSCGMERVQLWNLKGMPEKKGRGVFAEALISAMPQLPVEEEGRLCDPRLRENFVERVFAYQRLRDLFSGGWSIGRLVAFHTAHKLQLMAHSPSDYRTLGRLVAEGKSQSRSELGAAYRRGFMDALCKMATLGRNTNVLQHMAGYFRKALDAESRQELAGLIEDYRQGYLPLVVPLTLIRHHARRLNVEYLKGQTYLAPHPKELMLRNHV